MKVGEVTSGPDQVDTINLFSTILYQNEPSISLFGLNFFAFALCSVGMASGNPLGLLLGAKITPHVDEEKSACIFHWLSQVCKFFIVFQP